MGGGGGGVSLWALLGVTGGESSCCWGFLEYKSNTLWHISRKTTTFDHLKQNGSTNSTVIILELLA